MQQKKMTLKGLAQILGVHTSTVGRVMDPLTRHMVGEEVAQRVLKEAAKHGYRPNKMAASLRTRRSNIVGVILPDITNPVFPPIVLGIEDELRKHGYVALMTNAGEDQAQQRFVVDQLLARQVDALILATATRDDPVISHCLAAGVALVTVNRSEDRGRVSSVVNDEYAGMRQAVEHLLALGHRHMVHLVGPQNLSTGHLRKEGYELAMAANGVPREAAWEVEGSAYTREAGRAACLEAMARYPQATAILAGNDLLALGCYDGLRELGLRCPEDVSVVGHNDMPFVDMVNPPLTTVRISHHAMGVQAAQLVLKGLQQEGGGQMEIRLKPELVVRGSTAKPR
ncbi:LacI family DNA-binding transcriptional regulator [Pseudoduganella namucuonensis]|uniref:Transcriptional regulator, LacI family n=1 Tax=Pseudoduganella namucuonensis TaxID=1035707 RepID=A0A1I7IHT3_9BURK|nr:LacI family DNA-binding transcriptional regulator [Pseudoduganella namucuonensis]SFU72494.1 transcriptional regulator, LacI family [Pseudoduganella namucuonensis]